MTMNKPPLPSRGEVWLVDFDPKAGAEIWKRRPAIVMSEGWVGKLPLKIVVPVTDWKNSYSSYPWFVHLAPTTVNGLSKESGADTFQLKSLSLDRFNHKLGTLKTMDLNMIVQCITLCIGG